MGENGRFFAPKPTSFGYLRVCVKRVAGSDNLRADKALWVVCSLVVGAMQCNKKRLCHATGIKYVKFGF